MRIVKITCQYAFCFLPLHTALVRESLRLQTESDCIQSVFLFAVGCCCCCLSASSCSSTHKVFLISLLEDTTSLFLKHCFLSTVGHIAIKFSINRLMVVQNISSQHYTDVQDNAVPLLVCPMCPKGFLSLSLCPKQFLLSWHIFLRTSYLIVPH